MTDKQILKKAIQKAERNGWKHEMLIHPVDDFIVDEIYDNFQDYNLIFSHEFAKAFWGEENIKVKEYYNADLEPPEHVMTIGKDDGKVKGEYIQTWTYELPLWKICLKEMVISEEPLKYLEKFLEN